MGGWGGVGVVPGLGLYGLASPGQEGEPLGSCWQACCAQSSGQAGSGLAWPDAGLVLAGPRPGPSWPRPGLAAWPGPGLAWLAGPWPGWPGPSLSREGFLVYDCAARALLEAMCAPPPTRCARAAGGSAAAARSRCSAWRDAAVRGTKRPTSSGVWAFSVVQPVALTSP